MKKIMILIAAMVMTTLAIQAENNKPLKDAISIVAMEAGTPAPTDGDTNGTEVKPEG